MKIKYNKPRGSRIKKSQLRPMWIEPEDGELYFDTTNKRWVPEIPDNSGITTVYYAMRLHGCREVYSLKAAVRLINSWDVPVGTRFYVGLPWQGHSAIITKT